MHPVGEEPHKAHWLYLLWQWLRRRRAAYAPFAITPEKTALHPQLLQGDRIAFRNMRSAGILTAFIFYLFYSKK